MTKEDTRIPFPIFKKNDIEQILNDLESFGKKTSETTHRDERGPYSKLTYLVDNYKVRLEHNYDDIDNYYLVFFIPYDMPGIDLDNISNFGSWICSNVISHSFAF